jgi:death on curing protein
MSRWLWLSKAVMVAVHDSQLATHGGGAGVRDQNLLQSALARPANLAACGNPDEADLAAAYGFGISSNYAFIDGNKRTGFVAAEMFLILNGFLLTADDTSSALTMLAVSAGDLSEAEFAVWIRQHTIKAP